MIVKRGRRLEKGGGGGGGGGKGGGEEVVAKGGEEVVANYITSVGSDVAFVSLTWEKHGSEGSVRVRICN